MKKYLAIALAGLILSGSSCNQNIEFPKPPADKLECPNEPYAPEGEITDAKNAAYLKSMRAAWAGCFSDVAWFKDWFAKLQRR